MVDTHAHLGLCEPEAAELVSSAIQAGVRRILTVGVDEATNAEALEHAGAFEQVLACLGRHPNGAAGFGEAEAAALERLCADERVAAIGETGLDWYREGAPAEAQRQAFLAQIEIANRAGKPLVIHLRDREGSSQAVEEAFATLEAHSSGTVVLHCFSVGPEWVRRAAERGWYCSFAGNSTYPKAELLRESAASVPDELLLVETDSPYLAPQPVRGKPNQPANVVATAERLAEVRGVPYPELEMTVEANAARAFGW